MRSIRLSLTLCFLGLLLLSLGAASLFAWHRTGETLQAELETKEQYFESHHDKEVLQKQSALDEALHKQASVVASMLRYRLEGMRTIPHRYLLATHLHTFTMMSAPNSHLLVPTYLAAAPPSHRDMWSFHRRAMSGFSTKIKIDDYPQLPPFDHDSEVETFFQVNSAWGSTFYSPNMNGRTFGFDRNVFRSGLAIDHDFLETRLGDVDVRVVRLKVPAATFVPLNRWAPSRDRKGSSSSSRRGSHSRDKNGKSSSSRSVTPSRSGWDRRQPAVYVQFACALDQQRAELAKLGKDRDRNLELARAETSERRQQMRRYLLFLIGITFGGTALVTFWLVGIVLVPLRRLSDAVSQVSEKDFRLPLDDHRVPNEVTPLVERLEQTLEQMKHAFQREKQATADLSHDLRTPVASLLTTVDFALRKQRSGEEYRDALEECRLSAQQMNQIVERLLTLARLDAGVAAHRPVLVNVNEVAEQCLTVVRPLAEARELKISLHHDAILMVRTDPDKLREVLNNLLHNAIQYNQPSGTVNLHLEKHNDRIRIVVQDTGIGISETDQIRIFERFYRADSSRYTDDLNAGLGLAIVKGYVDLMGGSVAVESEPGKGSTFFVQLPA